MSLTSADYKTIYQVTLKDLSEINKLIDKLESSALNKYTHIIYHLYNDELIRIKNTYDKYRKDVEEKYPSVRLDEYENDKGFLIKYFEVKEKMFKNHNINGTCGLCKEVPLK